METNVQTQASKTPDRKYLVFQLNEETKYYELVRGEMGFDKVPTELKLEETRKKGIIHSDYLIRSRIKDGKYFFFTGLLPTQYEHWFYGDHFERVNGIKKNSFILFHFSQDRTRFEMFFFNHFKLYPNKRNGFVRGFLLAGSGQ